VRRGGRLASFESQAQWDWATPRLLEIWKRWDRGEFRGVDPARAPPGYLLHYGASLRWAYTSEVMMPPEGTAAFGAPHKEPWMQSEKGAHRLRLERVALTQSARSCWGVNRPDLPS
jgi:hypothetical protein